MALSCLSPVLAYTQIFFLIAWIFTWEFFFHFGKTKALRELSTDLSIRSDGGKEGYGSNAVMFQIQSDQTQPLTGKQAWGQVKEERKRCTSLVPRGNDGATE